MMKFPNLVYISPGAHQAPGGTFDYLSVKCEADLEKAAKAGYYPTPALAIEQPKVFDWGEWMGYPAAGDDDVGEGALGPGGPVENALEFRKALEQRAKALGVSFNARTSDEKLEERVSEAEAGEE